MKILLVTGAALAMLAAPAMAGHSTKAEIEATRQLNLQAVQSAASSPQRVPASEANMAMNAPPSAAPIMPVQTAAMDTRATLSTMNNPPSKIATANVLDASGRIVGAVKPFSALRVSTIGTPLATTGAHSKLE